MRADTPPFIITSVVLGAVWAVFLWFLFGNVLPAALFLVPFYSVIHMRATTSRMEELNDRLVTAMDLLVGVLEKNDPEFDIRDYFENNGIEDDDDFK